MKLFLKSKTIIIIDKKLKKRIIINFNDSMDEMALNTMLSIKEITDKTIKDKCYILNVNRYSSNKKDFRLKFEIKKPNIKICNINITTYLKSIENKPIIDFDEKDILFVIFTSNNVEKIFKYISQETNIDKIIFKLVN